METSLGALYEQIDAHAQLEVVDVKMNSRTALVRPDGLIAIDYSKIDSEAQERAVLLEEISHFEVFAFYTPGAPHYVWEKQEQRAQRHVFEKFFPPKSIAPLMARGYTESYQIAEQLDLPQRFVEQMLLYYVEIRGIDFNTLIDEMGEIPPEPVAPPLMTPVVATLKDVSIAPEPVIAQEKQAVAKKEITAMHLWEQLLEDYSGWMREAGYTACQIVRGFEQWMEQQMDDDLRRKELLLEEDGSFG